ncbi:MULTISPECIES: hypothetical protein [Shewanella]|uniref:hypothetical protein n=1 Tax=Shewanella TaxID=22 RepID=UPI00142FF533|nr:MULTISPECIES: hypothetical protein [Shewanella]MDC8852070.1 hypothetical protein [Shewanella algae]NJI83375.1 hypothetical protein [Shewanella sp. Iso12]
MKKLSKCIKKTALKKPITVGKSWFMVEHINRENGDCTAVVSTPKPGRAEGSLWLSPPKFLPENERVEIFEGVYLTFKDLSKQSRIVVFIEADKSVPIFSGFPYQWKEAFRSDLA